MREFRRAYDILRGYVNSGWDRLQGEETDAERELREAVEQPLPTIDRPRAPDDPGRPEFAASMSPDVARRLLGVRADATSRQIQDAFDELRAAVDPGKFQSGSPAWIRARDLQVRLAAAVRVLKDNLDPTVRRFEGLEIE